MLKLSVIITVYNMEAYVADAIEAVLNQTYRDLELIIIVDGGTDQSLEICNRFKEMDSRISVTFQPNGGAAAAKNRGLQYAKGEYIGFLDGDDWIEPDFYEALVGALEKENADIATCGFVKIENRQELKLSTSKEKSSSKRKMYVYTPEEGIAETFKKDKMRYSPCNKVYRRRLFEAVKYPEGILYDDKATTYRLFHLANKIVYLDTPKYHYFIHPDSVMRKPVTLANFTLFEVNEALIQFLEAYYPNLVELANESYAEECQKLADRIGEDPRFALEKVKCLHIINQKKRVSL